MRKGEMVAGGEGVVIAQTKIELKVFQYIVIRSL